MPATLRGCKIQRATLYMYHNSGHLQVGDKKLFDPNCSIVKYKKFVSLSDLRMGGGKDNTSGILFNFLEVR